MPRSYKYKEGQTEFKASQQTRLPLAKNYHNQYLLCKLEVNHDNSTAVFKSEKFANLINSIQIVANGNTTIKHVDVRKLVYNSLYDKGAAMVNDIKTADGTGLVSYIYFTIDFSARGMIRPADTILNTALFKTLDMLVDWSSGANVGTGITINSATLTVAANNLIDYSRNPGERISHLIETQMTEEITSSSSERQIILPIKKAYMKLLISANVDGVRSNDIINTVKIKSGTTVFAEWDAADLRADNIDRKGIKNASDVDGLLLLDFVGRGRMSDVLDTRGNFNSLELVLDVTKQTGTNNVTIYSDVFHTEQTIEVK